MDLGLLANRRSLKLKASKGEKMFNLFNLNILDVLENYKKHDLSYANENLDTFRTTSKQYGYA